MPPNFGWIEPTPEKLLQNNQYLVRNLNLQAPEAVEKIFTYPNYVAHYNQQNNGCTGFSASWMTSIYNNLKYDANWLYWEGRKQAGLPPNRDEGGYIWAVMDVLRKKGHREIKDGVTQPVKRSEGIESYYWAKTINDLRISYGQSKITVFGMYWYEEFMNPVVINGEKWIGTKSSWGRVLGGHAICCIGLSDSREGVLLLNSWGASYGDKGKVWIKYRSIEKLLQRQGEAAVALDYNPAPPPPPPTPVDEISAVFTKDNKRYSGTLIPQEV